jgi:hypothetical protein
MLKKLLISSFAALSTMLAGAVVVPDSIAAHFNNRVTATIEGVWQFADDGATIAIYADANTEGDYAVVCLDSPDLRLTPGTTLGWARNSLNDGKNYAASLYTNVNDNGSQTKRHKFTVALTNNTLELTAVRSGLKLDLWMLYRFFVTMSVHRQNPNQTLKAFRIYPPSPTPNSPFIL